LRIASSSVSAQWTKREEADLVVDEGPDRVRALPGRRPVQPDEPRRAGQAEFDPATAEVVEGRGPLGDPDRVVEPARSEHRGMTQPDSAGAL
jgi:hypothetical protein